MRTRISSVKSISKQTIFNKKYSKIEKGAQKTISNQKQKLFKPLMDKSMFFQMVL